MAAYKGSTMIRVGTRALSLAGCVERSTVARDLRALYAELDGPVMRMERGRVREADMVMLRLPNEVADEAGWTRWRAGFISPVHPLFLELGMTAFLVYDELGRHPVRSGVIGAHTGIAGRSVRRALASLGAHGLAVREGVGWVRVQGADLGKIAHSTEAMIIYRGRVERYRRDRAGWLRRLGVIPDDLSPQGSRDRLSAVRGDDEPCRTGGGLNGERPKWGREEHRPVPDRQEMVDAWDGGEPAMAPEPSWWRRAAPTWLRSPANAFDPLHVPAPEPPADDDGQAALDEAALQALILEAAHAGPLFAAPLPGDRPVWTARRRTGRRLLAWPEAAVLLGVSAGTAAALRPARRRWSRREIDRLLADPPPWLRGGEQTARAEAARRHEQAAKRWARRLAVRSAWAFALGVAADRLPSRLPAATELNIARVFACPPPWAIAIGLTL
jgi:hypothetical protein